MVLTDEQVEHMVHRFLGWRLPEHFSPDAGISFKPTSNDHMPFGPQKHNPIGTNLFDRQQAEAMVRYMVEGLPHDTKLLNAAKELVKSADKTGIDILCERIRDLREAVSHYA